MVLGGIWWYLEVSGGIWWYFSGILWYLEGGGEGGGSLDSHPYGMYGMVWYGMVCMVWHAPNNLLAGR